MAARVALLIIFVCWISENSNGVHARRLSIVEDLELEKELKLLNKPAVTTIRTIYGENYDCVDFYKQPTFDHPALKNHNFHYDEVPSLYPTGMKYKDSLDTHHQYFNNLWLNGEGCPVGTVPIKRITKDDLIRSKLAAKVNSHKYRPLTAGEHGTHYAVLRTNDRTGKKFSGAGMDTAIYNPPVIASQYSSSQVKIGNGGDSMEAGWTVNPSLYKDNNTRFFIYTNAGSSHCYNMFCPGFVLSNRSASLDHLLRISHRGADIYVLTIYISLDPSSGKWWLTLEGNIKIGYWPKQIFTGLADLATFVEWGGKTYSPPGVRSPPMGAGFDQLTRTAKNDAFCSSITTINEALVVVNATETSTYADISNYHIIDRGIGNRDNFGHVIFYGGSGSPDLLDYLHEGLSHILSRIMSGHAMVPDMSPPSESGDGHLWLVFSLGAVILGATPIAIGYIIRYFFLTPVAVDAGLVELSIPDGMGFDISDCSICLESFMEGETLRTLPCGHIFHEQCMEELTRYSSLCPLCLQDYIGSAPDV